jgi:predicted metal-dependent hydrolase
MSLLRLPRSLVGARKQAPRSVLPRQAMLRIDGRLLEVKIRLNPRARRMIVKVNPATGEVSVTAPVRGGLAPALAFARRERAWIARQLAQVPAPVALIPGITIPFRGAPHVIRAAKLGPAPVWCEGHVIFVRGTVAHAPRRVLDFLKRAARARLEDCVLAHAARLGVRPARISVRDTSTRWGSCSPARVLSFSWRLILAPDFVLDYVAAHEVAHLLEMNHGPRFWAHVQTLISDADAARVWLKTEGRQLQRYAVQ